MKKVYLNPTTKILCSPTLPEVREPYIRTAAELLSAPARQHAWNTWGGTVRTELHLAVNDWITVHYCSTRNRLFYDKDQANHAEYVKELRAEWDTPEYQAKKSIENQED